MALCIGIVGLPNVGKSTLFNALTRTQNAQAANYPFCTIEPNTATVPVPDERLEALAKIAKPQKVVHATVDFVDIAGLVKGASRGEGLGNKFLANIREASAILHVVRCFEDENVVHVEGGVDPLRDVGIIETELLLADMESMARYCERLGKQARTDKDVRARHEVAVRLKEHLDAGGAVSQYAGDPAESLAPILQEVQLLTDKKVIYVANVAEDSAGEDNASVRALRDYAAKMASPIVRICGKMEEELAAVSDAERLDFLKSYNVESSALDQVIRHGYDALGLASFLTAGPQEVRAWTIRKGWKAPKAAGVIHTDFEKGFIRAQVIPFPDYVAHGGEAPCKAAGLARMEGKDYVVSDGDVILFLFND
ncbi:MAG: redox-regulated ATPase YchF [Kiritimatiellaeota bacterium]|nr:redox-regulated ATPase YchF [Kiritimatiellota bacterium]